MLFNVETDTGDLIVGYLVPDTFSGLCSVAVLCEDKEVFRFETFEPRPALVAAGRHETGLCGFRVTEADVPGLSAMPSVELREVESEIAIYRRRNPEAIIHKKVFRLETHLLALNKLDHSFRNRFQFYFPSVERFGIETVHQMFLMNNTDSVLASGRLSYKSVEYYIDKGYEPIVMLHEPFEELAERLLVMRLLVDHSGSFLSMRDRMTLEGTIAFAASLQLGSDRELKRAFRTVDADIAATLSDPVTRQIVAQGPDEPLMLSSIGEALGVLANFAVVGLRRRADLFTETLAHRYSLHDGELRVAERIPRAVQLADRLRSLPVVERLLEHDLALYHLVSDAFEKSLTSDTGRVT